MANWLWKSGMETILYWLRWPRRVQISVAVTVICAVFIALMVNTEYGWKFLKWSSRMSVLQLNGIIDFYEYHNSKCLINNNFKIEESMVDDWCDVCENFDTVKQLYDNESGVDFVAFHAYFQMNAPVVVKRDNSKSRYSFDSIFAFLDAYSSNEKFSYYHPCQYQSNWKSKISDHWTLMSSILKQEVTSFYALWENCADIALKEFRQFYERPEFLGPTVQLTGSNWALVCSDFGGKRFKEIKLFTPSAVVFMDSGFLKIKLEPHDNCLEICSTITVGLKPGDVLLFSTDLYRLMVLPSCRNGDTIALGVGAVTD